MYESFYQLTENPFRLVPDPKFCFNHPSYDEAHAYLEYAFKLGEGFAIFTGRPGTGKTTLIHAFLNKLELTQVVAAKIAVTNMNAADLLRAVAYAFDINIADMDMAAVLRRVEQYFVQLSRAGKRSLLIIDEAQGLSRSALEELRMLADLQTESRFLLQIFLVGHEKLREFMVSPEMEQFQQRVTGTCKLTSLNQQESRDYIEYRLCQAGWSGDPELTGAAVSAIYQYSGGIPRHINKICTRLMLHGLLEEKHVLDKDDVLIVAEGLKDELLAPLFTQQVVIETSPADLAIKASSTQKRLRPRLKAAKPDVGAGVDRKAEKTRSTWSRTYVHRERKKKAALLANRIRQSVEPDTVFSVLAAVMLFLVVLVFNGKEDDKDNRLLASGDGAYETWAQLPSYRDGIHEEFPVYEEPAFVQKNRARRSAVQIVDVTEPVPGVIAEVSFAGATGEIAALEAAPDAMPPTIAQPPDVVEPPPAIEDVALPAAVSEPVQAKVAIIQKHDVARLLSLAHESLGDYRLMIPSGNNAYEYYRQVDTLDPGNKEAARGIGLIADLYVSMAEKAVRRDDEKMANLYIKRGLRLRPYNSELLALQTALVIPNAVEAPTQQHTVQELPAAGYSAFFSRLKDIVMRDQKGVPDGPTWFNDDYE